ncbi:MAG TPA: hypothetical protein VMR25_12325 [Planctomycetaceae bacterium]|jgi:hypothetical protein|nr:hypothetical protein [Planctomycetaceae bacterium]
MFQHAYEKVAAELAPNSQFLQKLRADTEQIVANGQGSAEATLVFAMQDRVIKPGSIEDIMFPGDRYEILPGHGHVSVCKVHRKRPEVLQHFLDAIRSVNES